MSAVRIIPSDISLGADEGACYSCEPTSSLLSASIFVRLIGRRILLHPKTRKCVEAAVGTKKRGNQKMAPYLWAPSSEFSWLLVAMSIEVCGRHPCKSRKSQF